MSATDPITMWAPENINQTSRERLGELIRAGGIAYLRANPERTMHESPWRDKPWTDGIAVDLDESDVVDAIVEYIVEHSDPEARS
jgi:hypothetical protein